MVCLISCQRVTPGEESCSIRSRVGRESCRIGSRVGRES